MFVDNKSISVSSDNLSNLENLMSSELKNLTRWLIANKLSLNIAKTQFLVIGSRIRLATYHARELAVTVNKKLWECLYTRTSLGKIESMTL